MAAEQTAQRTYEERMVAGRVDRENDTGIRVVQADGTTVWADFGQYFKGQRPSVGQSVELLVKGKFIRTAKILDAAGNPVAPEGDFELGAGLEDDPFAGSGSAGQGKGSAAPRPIHQAAPVPPARPQPAQRDASTPPPARSREGVRATTMLAAATFAAGRQDVDFTDVIGMAETLLAWVTDPRED